MAGTVKVYAGGLMVGPVAERPSILHAGDYQGQRYLASDEDKLYYSDGDEWLELFTPEGTQVGTASIADLAVTTAKLAAAAVTKPKLAGAFNKVELVTGQDETGDTTIPVTGMAVGDELVAVLVLTAAASIATIAQRALADFTVGAGVLNVVANAANNALNQYLIFWTDLT